MGQKMINSGVGRILGARKMNVNYDKLLFNRQNSWQNVKIKTSNINNRNKNTIDNR